MNAPDLPNEPPASQRASTEADTPELDKLTAQLILTFYGADALQEYRADNSLVPITVYQTVNNLNRLLAKRELEGRIDELHETLLDQNCYGPDYSYTSDPKGFYVVPKSELLPRLLVLREELAKYE